MNNVLAVNSKISTGNSEIIEMGDTNNGVWIDWEFFLYVFIQQIELAAG